MPARRLAVVLVLITLGCWLVAGALLCESALRIQRRVVTAQPASASNIVLEQSEHVQTTAIDGVVLRASFIRVAGRQDCVLLLHGISDSHESALGFAPIFVQAGYSVLAADSRAHGLSGGQLVTFGLLERTDVLRWASWLRQQGCQRLFGLGESLGGSILIQAAAQETVFSAIIAECPFRDFPAIAEHRIVEALNGPKPLLRALAKTVVPAGLLHARIRYALDLKAASPLNSARQLTTPLFLIHGADDTNTPPAHSRAIAAAAPNTVVWLVPGAGHTGASAKEPAEFRRRVLHWFESHQRPAVTL